MLERGPKFCQILGCSSELRQNRWQLARRAVTLALRSGFTQIQVAIMITGLNFMKCDPGKNKRGSFLTSVYRANCPAPILLC